MVERSKGCAVAGGDAIGNDGDGGGAKRRRELTQVGGDLGVGGVKGGGGVARVLELGDDYGKAVEVQDHVESAFDVGGPHSDLAHGLEGVVRGIVQIYQANGGGALNAVGVDVGVADSADDRVMEAPVFRERVIGLGSQEFGNGHVMSA